jgi:hypothetical protein
LIASSMFVLFGCGGAETKETTPPPTAEPVVDPTPTEPEQPKEPPKPQITYDHGRFIWFEHWAKNEKESAKAKAFYTQLLGWTIEDVTAGEMKLSMIKAGGVTPIGAFIVAPGHTGKATWMGYVSVPDVDAAVAAAKTGGAKLINEPVDVPEVGRRATLKDAGGGIFGVIKASAGDPPRGKGAGNWMWMELWTKDKKAYEAATKLYTETMGWETNPVVAMGKTYVDFTSGQTPRAGLDIAPVKGQHGTWFPYVASDDVDGVIKSVKKAKGKVIVKPKTVEGTKRFAVIVDPTGAKFALYGTVEGPAEKTPDDEEQTKSEEEKPKTKPRK